MRWFLIILVIIFVGIGWWYSQRFVSSNQLLFPQSSQDTSSNITATPPQLSAGKESTINFQIDDQFQVRIFAEGINQARDLQFSPSGTLLVSSSNNGQVLALPDPNQQGQASQKKVILSGLSQPHGLAFYNDQLYVAEVDQVVRYHWDEQNLTARLDKVLFQLPQNSNHNKRTLLFKDNQLFVSVGSTCNVCLERNSHSATILTSDQDGNNLQIFASGLRNAPFMALNPISGDIWATEMGRDHLGDNLPPDEINILTHSGQDYGWPYCFGQQIHDNNFDPQNRQSCQNTINPIWEIPAHSAPLGLSFIQSSQFPSDWQNDLLVALHGSWNRSTPIGYKVVRLTVAGNQVTGSQDFLSGFQFGSTTLGRPVDLTFDKFGNLYLSDDRAGVVYIIQKK